MSASPSMFSDYRSAFAEFARRATQARALMTAEKPDWPAIDAALLELEKSRLTYNHQRDLLAQRLSTNSAPLPKLDQLYASRVREIAQLRWELAGKPEGRDDDNWYRAEEILRRATAA